MNIAYDPHTKKWYISSGTPCIVWKDGPLQKMEFHDTVTFYNNVFGLCDVMYNQGNEIIFKKKDRNGDVWFLKVVKK